jgi:hypothetical protein
MIAVAAATMFIFMTAAQAQPCTCNIVNGCKIITFYNAAGVPIGTQTICPTTGTGTFGCNIIEPPPPPTGALNVSVPPVGLNSTAISPTFGPITTALDLTRTSTNATIISNGADRFPATVRFSFFATATVNGVRYCSRTELEFLNQNVTSFNPFNNEVFTLQRDVAFVANCNLATSPTVFLLRAGSQVTLN